MLDMGPSPAVAAGPTDTASMRNKPKCVIRLIMDFSATRSVQLLFDQCAGALRQPRFYVQSKRIDD